MNDKLWNINNQLRDDGTITIGEFSSLLPNASSKVDARPTVYVRNLTSC